VGRGCPTGGRVWEGSYAPSPENFSILKLRIKGFGAFWALLFTVQLPVLHAKNWYSWAWKTCRNYLQCTASTQKSKRQNMHVGNSRVKIILYGIGCKMF